MKRCLALLALLSSTSMLAQDGTFRVTVLSYQWTTSHNPVSFTWQGHSNTSCNGTSNDTGYASGSGTSSANGTSYESCSTTFTPPNTQTIDVQKPVVFVLAETANSRMVLSCTRNVRWSQCEALSPGFFIARFDRGHFEVQSGNGKGKVEWVRFDVVQQSAIQHPVPQPVPETEAKVVSAPIGSDDAARVASYRQECSNGDMQGCINLGTMYRMGWGVSKDLSQADALFKCAGTIDGCTFLEAVGPQPPPSKTGAAPLPSAQASVSIDSTPSGADIEIDGAFVGNTPSTISIASGSHQVAVKKKGFTDWSKTLNVTGGTIRLKAGLEQEPAMH